MVQGKMHTKGKGKPGLKLSRSCREAKNKECIRVENLNMPYLKLRG